MAPSGGSIDPTMLELFAAEVDMHLPILSEGLLALEKGRAGKKEIESMMRAAHSIKGAARIVGIDPAVRIAHTMEDCFTAAKEERITLGSDAVDILLQGVDALQRTCAPDADPAFSEESLQALIQRIAAVREAHPAAATPSPAAPPAPSPPPAAAPAITIAPTPSDTLLFPARVDHAAAESLRRQFITLLDPPPSPIRIDFGQVEQLSVAAMALLLSFAGEARAHPGTTIEARHVAPPLRTLFRVVGLDSALALPD